MIPNIQVILAKRHKWKGLSICETCKATRTKINNEYLYSYISGQTFIEYHKVKQLPSCWIIQKDISFDGENWKSIPGFPNYHCSDLGRIKSTKNNYPRILKNQVVRGYRYVVLSNQGKAKRFRVNRVVMLTFVGPSHLQVNHKNGIKHDDRLVNLEYTTAFENGLHANENNLKGKLKTRDIILIREQIKQRIKLKDIAKSFNVNPSSISRIRSGKLWIKLKTS